MDLFWQQSKVTGYMFKYLQQSLKKASTKPSILPQLLDRQFHIIYLRVC